MSFQRVETAYGIVIDASKQNPLTYTVPEFINDDVQVLGRDTYKKHEIVWKEDGKLQWLEINGERFGIEQMSSGLYFADLIPYFTDKSAIVIGQRLVDVLTI